MGTVMGSSGAAARVARLPAREGRRICPGAGPRRSGHEGYWTSSDRAGLLDGVTVRRKIRQ